MIPLFFDLDLANTWRSRNLPDSVITSVKVDGKPAWIVQPKKELHKLYTLRILLGNNDKIDDIIDTIHGDFTADCRLSSAEEVDVGEDYKWDCSFFDEEKV